MPLRSSLHRPLSTAVALAAFAAPLGALQLDGPPRVDPITGRRPVTPTVSAPAPEAERVRVRVRKEAPAPGIELGDPDGLFAYLLTPSEMRPRALAAVPAAPFSMPTVGAAPSGGSRWLWILPLAMLPFFTDGGGSDDQPAENNLPPETPPVTPPAGAPATPPPGSPFDSPPPAAAPVSTVPEPMTVALVGAGLLGVGAAARRRRR